MSSMETNDHIENGLNDDYVLEMIREGERDRAGLGVAHMRMLSFLQERLAQADTGGPFVIGDDVKRWLRSWGKEDELPVPEATIRF